MGLRFRKSIKIANGVKLNVSKSGVSLSLGKKGLHYTINSKGKSTATVGLPGTGLSYSKRFDLFGGLKSLFTRDEKETKVVEDKVVKIDDSAAQTLADYNEYLEKIRSFHESVSKAIDWFALANGEVPNDKSDEEKAEIEHTIELAKKVMANDGDAYLEVLEKYSPIEDMSAFGSDFEFGNDDSDTLCGEFTVNIDEVVPQFYLKEKNNGEIEEVKYSATKYNELSQDYVCSCAIRVAREVFSLLPVDLFVLNATNNVLDSSTGNNKEATILSVLFVREGFDNINFEMIDPSDFVDRFKANVKFTKTGGFKEVDQIKMPKITG